MQLNMTTDYAIRSILYIAESERTVTVEDVGGAMGIPLSYVRKMFYRLTKAGLIEAQRGRKGGYLMARPAREISLWDIANSTEQTMQINLCLEDQGKCSRRGNGRCVVRQFYTGLQGLLEEEMKRTTIQSLIDMEKES